MGLRGRFFALTNGTARFVYFEIFGQFRQKLCSSFIDYMRCGGAGDSESRAPRYEACDRNRVDVYGDRTISFTSARISCLTMIYFDVPWPTVIT